MMNNIKYSISALMACLALASCQNIDEPEAMSLSVTTNDVTNLTGHKASFSGVVSTNSTCYFLLSQTVNLTEPVTVPATREIVYGSDSTVISNAYYYTAQYDSLAPGNDYYLAMCASDGITEVKGNVVSFTTPTYLTIKNLYLTDIDGYATNSYYPTEALGSFVLTNWSSSNYNVWGSYQNMKTTYSNREFAIDGGNEISLSSDVKVFAYYPYTTEYSNNTIPIYANETLYGETPTYLYGSSTTVNADNTEALLTMHYALAKVTLSITNTNTQSSSLTKVSIEDLTGENIASRGYMNVFTGDISNLQNFEPQTRTCQQTLTSSAFTVDYMIIPTSFGESEVVVKFTVDGKEIQLSLPAATWNNATHYTYQLSVDKDALKLGGIRVEQWDSQNSGSIDIKQN